MTVPAAGSSVLVLEDHPFQRRALARKLNGLGVRRVLEAAQCNEALEILRANGGSIALILSDLDMPETDGLEFLRRLAADAPHTAIAVLGALDRPLLRSIENVAAECGLQLVGVLEKPASEDALRAVLVRSLAGDTAARARESEAQAAEIVAALASGELVPWFQPKVNLHTAQVCGVEVLVRWERSGLPPLAPAHFLDAVAAAGRMHSMTLALAAAAVRHLKALPARDLSLSINIGRALLDEPRFAAALASTLAEAGASPREVILEIPETAVAPDQDAALESLTRLRARGFELSLDDFGTGLCSLAQLVRAPISELKIDRTLIGALTVGGTDRLLVDSIVLLARRLNLRTVAEGIETQAELEALRRLGCEMGQGYLIARPMPASDWLAWMRGPPRPMWDHPAAPDAAAG